MKENKKLKEAAEQHAMRLVIDRDRNGCFTDPDGYEMSFLTGVEYQKKEHVKSLESKANIPAHRDNAEEWLQINKDIWPKGNIMISPELMAEMMTEFANEWLAKQGGYDGLDTALRKTWDNDGDDEFDGC